MNKEIYIDWSVFKTYFDESNISQIRYVESALVYTIWFNDKDNFITQINKDNGADQQDFETNYKASCNKPNTAQDTIVLRIPPFADPEYKIKIDAGPAIVECAAEETKNIDCQITEEIYCYGGEMIINGAKLGDYVAAEIRDIDEVIPEQYRESLCEDWPTVVKYIVKRYVQPFPSTESTLITIDTRPLAGKITAGLYLRMSYTATAEVGTRKILGNYFYAVPIE